MAFDAIMMVHGWTSIWSKPQDFNLTIEKICDHMDHIAGNARHVGIGSLLAALSPATVDDGWLSLRQAWRPNGNEEHFQPGWARIRWVPDAYWIDAIFCGGRAANRATRLNKRTWELGDVAEVFLEEVSDSVARPARLPPSRGLGRFPDRLR
jgi:hypothetical protein